MESIELHYMLKVVDKLSVAIALQALAKQCLQLVLCFWPHHLGQPNRSASRESECVDHHENTMNDFTLSIFLMKANLSCVSIHVAKTQWKTTSKRGYEA